MEVKPGKINYIGWFGPNGYRSGSAADIDRISKVLKSAEIPNTDSRLHISSWRNAFAECKGLGLLKVDQLCKIFEREGTYPSENTVGK